MGVLLRVDRPGVERAEGLLKRGADPRQGGRRGRPGWEAHPALSIDGPTACVGRRGPSCPLFTTPRGLAGTPEATGRHWASLEGVPTDVR